MNAMPNRHFRSRPGITRLARKADQAPGGNHDRTATGPDRRRQHLLSLDGRVTGPGGEYDMGWIVPHAGTDGHAPTWAGSPVRPPRPCWAAGTTWASAGFWPAVADDENAHPRDRAFARWLDEAEKVVVSRTLREAEWRNSRVAADDPPPSSGSFASRTAATSSSSPAAASSRQLLDADEVDRLSITLCPEMVGGGRPPVRGAARRPRWTVAGPTPTRSGAFCLRYDLIRPAATGDR